MNSGEASGDRRWFSAKGSTKKDPDRAKKPTTDGGKFWGSKGSKIANTGERAKPDEVQTGEGLDLITLLDVQNWEGSTFADGTKDIREKRILGGRERDIFATIQFSRNYDQNQHILSLGVKQMDCGIVNICECSELVDPCKNCKGDNPFIRKISVRVKPKLPEGTTVQNTLGKPVNSASIVNSSSSKSGSMQFQPANPLATGATLQVGKAVAVNSSQFGFQFARFAPRGDSVALTWELSTWKRGEKLNWRPFFQDRELPLDARKMQIHPDSLSQAWVGGQWHIDPSSTFRLDQVTFEIGVDLHTSVLKRVLMTRFVTWAVVIKK